MTLLNKDKILDAAKEFVTQGKYDKAIREYEKILEADPKDMRVKLRIAELLTKHRQVPEAIKTYCEVAQSYAAEGFYLKAVTIYKSILRLNPSRLDINVALSELYEKMGLHVDAVHQYEILASAYEQKRQFDEALNIREKLVELSPHDFGHRIRLAEAYQREERKEDAVEQYEVLARQYEEQKKEPQRLLELYERILPYRPQNIAMLKNLVQLHHDKKDYKGALKWLEQAKSMVAGDADLLNLQAQMYGGLNQIETARGKYLELAALYLKEGQKEKALEAYEAILVMLPEEMETLRPQVEAIESGAMERLSSRALEKRRATEEAALPVEGAALPATASALPTVPFAAEEKRPAAMITKRYPVAETKEIPMWLNKAGVAMTLAKAYQSMGLESEAGQEWQQAFEALNRVLAADAEQGEAKKMVAELPASFQRPVSVPESKPPLKASPKPKAEPKPEPVIEPVKTVAKPEPVPVKPEEPVKPVAKPEPPKPMPPLEAVELEYLKYFGLTQEPFSIVPLTHFYFGSEQHDRAMEKLRHAVRGMKGLAVVIGGVGLGKTLLAKRLLESLPKNEFEALMLVILHEDVDALWLLQRIAALAGVEEIPEKKIDIVTKLYDRLAEVARQGRKVVVIIDEAHLMRGQALMEEIRGMLNLELASQKLLTFVLFGMPELEKNMGADPALAQRVAVRFNLKPLPEAVAARYIAFRLEQAGAKGPVFSEGAVEKILECSHRIPRLINVICDNALFEGHVRHAALPLGEDIIIGVVHDLGLMKSHR